ncbi:hypothetical protein [Aureimonas sp. AU4]|uniref:hypothetical protein n=1 Tax=Aureimonas sp. AU4 TaxID=1638163 RepID=UPI000783F61A|nr:hypothetical protein [Aureimonas sp. AU4]
MTNRYMPNEATCPVDLELLGLLLRSPEARVVEIVDALESPQRADLAAFCFGRAHMRDLAILIARQCSDVSLREANGFLGEMLIEHAQAAPVKVRSDRRTVTLARAA